MGVRAFWKREGEAELAARLKRRRERARPEFVNELAREVRSTGSRRFVPSRLLLAAALTLIMLVALASVGGTAGAGVRAQLVSVVKSVHKQVNTEPVTAPRSNDDDDGGGGGGGGRGDDDDDGGDDDGDDDQYEEDEQKCEVALGQAHATFHLSQSNWRVHRGYHRQLAAALDDCDDLGGGDDDDDD
jgi:hypothetical protein